MLTTGESPTPRGGQEVGRGLPGEEEERTALSVAQSEGPARAHAQGERLVLPKPCSGCELISLPINPQCSYRFLCRRCLQLFNTLRIIKHIEQHQSCDWLISKELTN